MSDQIDTKVVQVSNIAPNATREQMKTLFSYLGRIDEIQLYPTETSELQVTAKVCYVKYDDCTSVGVALHLTNTVFIDRALVVVPVMDEEIPDEQSALQRASSAVAGMLPGQPTWPSNVISQLQSVGGCQVIITNDPRLTALGLSQYPPLPSNTDPSKIEEIRRTVYVSNLDGVITGDQIMTFFGQIGEIKFVRMGGEEVDGNKCAYIEFTDQRSIATALTYNGVMFQGRPLSVAHSTSAIDKPKTKMQEAAQREIEEAMKKVKEAQSLITAAADLGDLNIDKTVSKLASSFGRSRSRSRSRSRRHRSRSRSRRRSSRSRSRHRRSRSRHRSRSKRRSRSRKRSRSGSRKKRSSSKTIEIPKPTLGLSGVTIPVVGITGLKKPGPGMPGGPGTGRKRSRSPSRQRRSRSRSRRRRTRSRSPRRRRSRSRRRSHSRSRRSSFGKPTDHSTNHRSFGKPTDHSTNHRSSPSKGKTFDRKRSTSRGRSHSPSRKDRRSRSRSRNRKTTKSRRRSRSGSRKQRSRSRKRSRSRSGSRHRSRKDKKKDKERDRSRDREKKKKHKDKERDRDEKKESKVRRDYDEEEKLIAADENKARAPPQKSSSDEDDDDDDDRSGVSSPERAAATRVAGSAPEDTDLQQVDMEMSD